MVAISGCSIGENDEQAIKSSSDEYMENFMLLMDKKKIPYRYSDGYVWYKYKVKREVEKVEKMLSSTMSSQYKDEEVREYFRSLLDKEGVDYIPLSKDGGSWTMWWPRNEEQDREIELNVQIE